MLQPGAGKTLTIKAELDFGAYDLLTVLDPACQNGFHFEAVISPASRADHFVSFKCTAEAAVHAARSNQCRENRFCPS
jgi:hypothetical protein